MGLSYSHTGIIVESGAKGAFLPASGGSGTNSGIRKLLKPWRGPRVGPGGPPGLWEAPRGPRSARPGLVEGWAGTRILIRFLTGKLFFHFFYVPLVYLQLNLMSFD